jgi:glycine cleavage system H lipoate-binding protein
MTMQEPGYVDIFATKGFEYLLVIAFLATFVLFWVQLNKLVRPRRSTPSTAGLGAAAGQWFMTPLDRYYHTGHSWVLPEEDTVVTLGIDDFAQKLVGKPSALRLPGVGEHLEQGAPGWKLEFDGTSIDQLSPVDGEVIATNDQLAESPELVNLDPYGDGWLMQVRVSKMKQNLTNLLQTRLAKAWIETSEDTLRRMVSGELGMVLQDGGVPVSGIARSIAGDDWENIARDFLLTA